MLRIINVVLHGVLLQLAFVFLSPIRRGGGATPRRNVRLSPGRHALLFQHAALLQGRWLFSPPDAEAASKSPRQRTPLGQRPGVCPGSPRPAQGGRPHAWAAFIPTARPSPPHPVSPRAVPPPPGMRKALPFFSKIMIFIPRHKKYGQSEVT